MERDELTGPEAVSGYMSVQSIARWADVLPRTVQRWLKQGLPFYQVRPRSRVLIRPSDVAAFLRRHEESPSDLSQLVEDVFSEMVAKEHRKAHGQA